MFRQNSLIASVYSSPPTDHPLLQKRRVLPLYRVIDRCAFRIPDLPYRVIDRRPGSRCACARLIGEGQRGRCRCVWGVDTGLLWLSAFCHVSQSARCIVYENELVDGGGGFESDSDVGVYII